MKSFIVQLVFVFQGVQGFPSPRDVHVHINWPSKEAISNKALKIDQITSNDDMSEADELSSELSKTSQNEGGDDQARQKSRDHDKVSLLHNVDEEDHWLESELTGFSWPKSSISSWPSRRQQRDRQLVSNNPISNGERQVGIRGVQQQVSSSGQKSPMSQVGKGGVQQQVGGADGQPLRQIGNGGVQQQVGTGMKTFQQVG